MTGFGESAARLSGAAAAILGWRPADFWGATPTEFALALQFPAEVIEGPDSATIEALRRRFPDEMIHG